MGSRPPPGHAYTREFEQRRRGAALGRGLGIDDAHPPERQVERLRPGRVLVQEEHKVGLLALRGRQVEQHLTRSVHPIRLRGLRGPAQCCEWGAAIARVLLGTNSTQWVAATHISAATEPSDR